MIIARTFRTAVIVLSLTAISVSAKEPVPVVYEDAYITVHAGLPAAGTQAVHLGDALSLVIEVIFDARQVQIERLDDDVFQRAFSAMPSIRAYAPAIVTTRKEAGDRVRATSYWQLQVLACPDKLTNCPGSRLYELPVITIAYQLIGDLGSSAEGRAARFRPWPGSIDVAPAIAVLPTSDTKLTDVIPGGAYDSQQPVAELATVRSLLLVAGALLLLTGLLASAREHRPRTAISRTHDNDSRWEQALAQLRNGTLSDDEWSDLLRRCVTWYCMDDLGRNPYAWLGAAAVDAANHSDPASPARDYFLDVLHQAGIEPNRRADYLDRLLSLTATAQNAATAERQHD